MKRRKFISSIAKIGALIGIAPMVLAEEEHGYEVEFKSNGNTPEIYIHGKWQPINFLPDKSGEGNHFVHLDKYNQPTVWR